MIQPDSASQNGDANHQKDPKGALAFDSCSDFCSVEEAPACWYYHQIHSAKWIIITDHDCYHHRSPGISPNESPHLELLSSALVSVQAAPAPEKPSEKKPDAEKALSTAIGSEMSLAPLVERR